MNLELLAKYVRSNTVVLAVLIASGDLPVSKRGNVFSISLVDLDRSKKESCRRGVFEDG